MPNDYSRQWFEVFLDTIPTDLTQREIEGVVARLPLPAYRRVIDICCGPGRHAEGLVAAGYEVTGIDRDANAIEEARRRVPSARFTQLDQRDLAQLSDEFDGALILWQSFGYFSPSENDQVLAELASLLRRGGRLLLDVFHPRYFQQNQGRTTRVRDTRCTAITNRMEGARLTSTIEYADGREDAMNWELFAPDELADRASGAGFEEVERCIWWDNSRQPSGEEQRYQLVLQKR